MIIWKWSCVKLFEVEELLVNGESPFRKWLDQLDKVTKERIQARILRFKFGNFGDHKFVGDKVWEARIHFGAGYRVYYAIEGHRLVLLIVGGDKRAQFQDIQRAKAIWREYEWRKK